MPFYTADSREMTGYEGREMGNGIQQKSPAWYELGTLWFMVSALTTRSPVIHNVIAQIKKPEVGLESLVFACHSTTQKHQIAIWLRCLNHSYCLCHTEAAFMVILNSGSHIILGNVMESHRLRTHKCKIVSGWVWPEIRCRRWPG